MRKRVILWFLAGWALAIFLSPRDVVGWIKPKSA